jgi:DNA-directed RNA polymerase subunit E'/Rpb7
MSSTASLFTKSIITDNARLSCAQLTNQYKSYVKLYVQNKYEGKCSRYGYTRTGSIEILKVSVGNVRMFSLNGDAIFKVQFRAEICNPLVGQVMSAIVLNVNKFGVLASGGTFDGDTGDMQSILPIVDIVIPKVGTITSVIDMSEIKPGDRVAVEILGKKFNINDSKISAIGRVKAIEFVSEGVVVGDNALVSNDEDASLVVEEIASNIGEEALDDEVDADDVDVEDEEEDEEDDEDSKTTGKVAKKGSKEDDDEDDDEEGVEVEGEEEEQEEEDEDDNNSAAASDLLEGGATLGVGGFAIDSDDAFDEGAAADDVESEDSQN